MSDSCLRRLERAWQSTRSPAAEAAYLRARVRAGTLGAERLALTSYCGHGPGELGPAAAEPFVAGLARWGREVAVRAGAVACRAAVGPATALPGSKRFARCLGALGDWVDCPCPAHLGVVQRAHGGLRGGGVEVGALACLVWAAVAEEPEQGARAASLALRPLATLAPERELLSAIRGDLLRWALDPR